jgi:hypothetical protein
MNLNISLSAAPLVALVAGILILIMPKLLNYIIAIYLILIGLLGLFGSGGSFHMH